MVNIRNSELWRLRSVMATTFNIPHAALSFYNEIADPSPGLAHHSVQSTNSEKEIFLPGTAGTTRFVKNMDHTSKDRFRPASISNAGASE